MPSTHDSIFRRPLRPHRPARAALSMASVAATLFAAMLLLAPGAARADWTCGFSYGFELIEWSFGTTQYAARQAYQDRCTAITCDPVGCADEAWNVIPCLSTNSCSGTWDCSIANHSGEGSSITTAYNNAVYACDVNTPDAGKPWVAPPACSVTPSPTMGRCPTVKGASRSSSTA